MDTSDVEDLIRKLTEDNAGYENLIFQVTSLVTTYPPPFLYINDPTTPRIASSVLRALLLGCSKLPLSASPQIRFANVNAVACFTARVFYDTVLNAMARWTTKWEDGCENWSDQGSGQRWNESIDGFLHGLRAIYGAMGKVKTSQKVKGKGKGKEKETEDGNLHWGGDFRMVLVVEKAERLKETLPDLMVPLTRLAELTQTQITVIFVSSVRWQDIKPPFGASPGPYQIDICSPNKEATLSRLTQLFERESCSVADINPYHPALLPLYDHFCSILYSICSPFTHDPYELAYISAARWPGFVQPILDDHQRQIELRRQQLEESGMDIEGHNSEFQLAPPLEDTRMRLTRFFTPSFPAALEALYPRLTNAYSWSRENAPEPDLLALPPARVSPLKSKLIANDSQGQDVIISDVLPQMSKFILVAAFLASTNPAKTDLRMFGRGLDERRKKRRKGGSPRKGSGKNAVAKVPQRLLGPAPFPLDRLIAIFGVLLEENDVDSRQIPPQFTIPGEYTDMEIGRVQVYAAIMELTQNRLLHRTTQPDRLDGPPMFKCGVSYDVVLALARDVDVPLNDLMWDPA